MSLIAQINASLNTQLQESATMKGNYVALAEAANCEANALEESVTNLLANLAQNIEDGKPITVMMQNTCGAFLAGVDLLAQAMPQSMDMNKAVNAVRVLNAIEVEADGMANKAIMPVVKLGAQDKNKTHEYAKLVVGYNQRARGSENQELGPAVSHVLLRHVRRLQQKIDQAMRRTVAASNQTE